MGDIYLGPAAIGIQVYLPRFFKKRRDYNLTKIVFTRRYKIVVYKDETTRAWASEVRIFYCSMLLELRWLF